jgi:ABC-type dipeptide/oligopeptide/nickel transport system ATPase component
LEVALLLGVSGLLLAGRLVADSQEIIPILAIYLAGATRIFPSLLRIQSSIFSLRSYSYLATTAHDLLDTLGLNRSFTSPKEKLNLDVNKQLSATDIEGFKLSSDTSITLTNVEFSYPNSESKVVEGITFKIEPGERVAIVGPSGAGKSTLCDIFLGLLQPTFGVVQIGGIAAAKWIEDNVGKISYLPQETTLVTGTFLDNICLGVSSDEVDLKRVQSAVKSAQLDDFLEQLPEGLNTHFGVSGTELSGGQKQRIGIARALYSDPKIILMDEATSALDAETEHAIINILEGLDTNTTVIFIAHRLSSIRNFPRIMYFEDGALKEDGSFDHIRSRVPRFANQIRLLGL